MSSPSTSSDAASGLIVGGLGGPEEELLESGQEEVFARSEVESGRIEHAVTAGGHSAGVSDDEVSNRK